MLGEVHLSMIIEGSIERIGRLVRSRRGTPATVDDDAACGRCRSGGGSSRARGRVPT